MFNGLADVGLIDAESFRSRVAQSVSYVGIFGAYVYVFLCDPNGQLSTYLYMYLILFTCGLYVACELVYIVLQHHYDGVPFILLAAVCGVCGLFSMMMYPAWLCHLTTPFFGNIEAWFFLSDVAMLAIFAFYWRSHASQVRKSESDDDNDRRSGSSSFPADSEDSAPLIPIYTGVFKTSSS
jgi:hypothetical protein